MFSFAAVQCDHGWVHFSKSCYLRVNTRVTWFLAQKMCKENEANLVTVNDEDEMNFLGSLMKDKGSWNGLHFKANSKDGVWSSGERSDYRNWAKTGPKRISKLPLCVQMAAKLRGLKWGRFKCSLKYRFICEKGWLHKVKSRINHSQKCCNLALSDFRVIKSNEADQKLK